jgi:hypothetical protein
MALGNASELRQFPPVPDLIRQQCKALTDREEEWRRRLMRIVDHIVMCSISIVYVSFQSFFPTFMIYLLIYMLYNDDIMNNKRLLPVAHRPQRAGDTLHWRVRQQ